jgi:Protein of unknown function (DUF2510)
MTNIFNSINSLFGLLVLILIIAAVVLVVRAVVAPRAERPPRSEQVVVQQPPATSGLSPGWYPDQNDPDRMRYFDGRVWTAQSQPRT